VYKEILQFLKEEITELGFTNISVGERDWDKILSINKPMVELLPGSGTRSAYSLGGPAKENWTVELTLARKGLATNSETLEYQNLDDMTTIIGYFKNLSTTISNQRVAFSVSKFDADRVLTDKQEFYLIGFVVIIDVQFIK